MRTIYFGLFFSQPKIGATNGHDDSFEIRASLLPFYRMACGQIESADYWLVRHTVQLAELAFDWRSLRRLEIKLRESFATVNHHSAGNQLA